MLIFYLASNLTVIICRLLHNYSTAWWMQAELDNFDILSTETTLIGVEYCLW